MYFCLLEAAHEYTNMRTITQVGGGWRDASCEMGLPWDMPLETLVKELKTEFKVGIISCNRTY